MFLLLAILGCNPKAEIPENCDYVTHCTDGSILLDCTDAMGEYYQVFWTDAVDDIDAAVYCDGGKQSDECQLIQDMNYAVCT